MTDVHEVIHLTNLTIIYQSGEYSDMTVVCGTREFPVHRAVICPRSKFFEAACNGSFQESITKKIVLEDDDPDTVDRMLLYLYACNYHDGTCRDKKPSKCSKESETEGGADWESGSDINQIPQVTPGLNSAESLPTKDPEEHAAVEFPQRESITESPLLNNVMVYVIAEKYDIRELKDLAKTKFLNHIDTLLSANEFSEVIKTIYKLTPPTDRCLREIVSQECAKQVRELMKDKAFKDIISEVGDFGVDILDEALKYDDEQLARVVDQKKALDFKIKESKTKMARIQYEIKDAKNTLEGVIRKVDTINTT